jgi:glycosyltransferase involved in cell wall biosynthesis
MPAISIIIPMHNSERTIQKCLQAVFASNFRDFEVIAVDDASADNTLKIVKKFPCKVICLKNNSGPAAARNIGAKTAKGEILLFLDADAVLKKDTLQRIVEDLKGKNLDAVGGLISAPQKSAKLTTFYKNAHHHYFQIKLPEEINVLSGVLFAIRKEAFRKVKGFREDFKEAEDIELSQRLLENGFKIQLDKNLEVEHMQEYSLQDILKKDFWKAFHWARLLFGHFRPKTVLKEKCFTNKPLDLLLSIATPFFTLFSLAAFFFTNLYVFLLASLLFFLAFLVLNFGFFSFMARLRGCFPLILLVPLRFLNMLAIALGALLGTIYYIFHKFSYSNRKPPTTR